MSFMLSLIKRKGTEQGVPLPSSQGRRISSGMFWRIYRGSPGLWRPRGLWGAEERGWWLLWLIKTQGTSRRAFWRRCSDSNCRPTIGFKGEGVRRSREQVLRERQGWVRGFLKSLYKRKVGPQHLRGGNGPFPHPDSGTSSTRTSCPLVSWGCHNKGPQTSRTTAGIYSPRVLGM